MGEGEGERGEGQVIWMCGWRHTKGKEDRRWASWKRWIRAGIGGKEGRGK